MITQLARLSHALASIPSLVYGLLYLSLVPLFAYVYSRLPHKSFHHATIQYEESVGLTERELRNELTAVLSRNLERGLGPDRMLEGWKVAAPRLGNLEIGSNDVTTRLYSWLSFGGTPIRLAIQLQCNVRFNLHPIFIRDDKDFKQVGVDESEFSASLQRIRSRTPNTPPLDDHRLLQIFFLPLEQESRTPPEGFGLAIPSSLSRKFEEYADALNGFPTMLKGHFLRMLYLSAVTITTSFGDILPITGTARTLVTIQSMAGVVIIGLFLNSLAYQWGK
jgi:Ion channel